MDLLRLAGAPGVGKSTTAWALAQRLRDGGEAVGYVDTDQLGMCYPASVDDPDRWRLKERALGGVADAFRRSGVERMVVSGVAWPDEAPPAVAGASVRSIWLGASEPTRRERLAPRRLSDAQLQEFLAAGTAEAQRVHPAWERLDTDGMAEGQTLEAVMERWKRSSAELTTAAQPPEAAPPTRVLWLTGPRLAGASSIGWHIVSSEWSAQRRTGFIDAAQLRFVWNTAEPIGLAALERLHDVLADAGADRFVVVAPFQISPEDVCAALPTADVAFVRLRTSDEQRRSHAQSRRVGGGPVLAGDGLANNASCVQIDEVLADGRRQADAPARAGEIAVSNAGLSVEDAADAVRRACDW